MNKITAREAQEKISEFEAHQELMQKAVAEGIDQFIKDAGLSKEDAEAVVNNIGNVVAEFEKYSAAATAQVEAFIDQVEAQLEKAGATDEQAAYAWIDILQRMGQ